MPDTVGCRLRALLVAPLVLMSCSGASRLPATQRPPGAVSEVLVGDSLEQLLCAARSAGARCGCLARPSAQALGEALAWSRALMKGGDRDRPVPVGFLEFSVRGSRDLVVLTEAAALRSGGGVYAFRLREAQPVVIQAPHSFADLETLPLALALFRGLSARGLLVNTVHRKCGDRFQVDRGRSRCGADVAHCAQSLFHHVHRGVLETQRDLLVIAVHGFARAEEDPDVILSAAGTATELQPFADALRGALPDFRVETYPDQIDKLGGMKGVQAQHLRQLGGRMLHLELGRELREALAADGALQSAFVGAFVQSLGGGS